MSINGTMPLLPTTNLDQYHHHHRTPSASSTSSSRPQSSHGAAFGLVRAPSVLPAMPAADDIYRASFPLGRPANTIPPTHTRASSNASSYSLASTPADSPPSQNNPIPAHKAHLVRTTHMRPRSRVSPYPREPPSHSGSESVGSSDADDLAMFLSGSPSDYSQSMYVQEPMPIQHASGAFGRMTLSPDHALEQLAASVRAATTTSASDRAKQIFVQAWLNANYAPYPDGNVPRQGLYFSYRRVCEQYGIPHINTATLGKAIRLCFPAIKTRRLGVRGNSKYHYCGIRPATSQEAEFLQEYVRKSNNNNAQQPGAPIRSVSTGSVGHNADRSEDDDEEEDSSEGGGASTQSNVPSKRNSLNLNGLKSPSLYHSELSDRTPTTSSVLSAAQGGPRHASSNGFPAPAAIRRRSGLPGDGSFVAPTPSHPQPSPPAQFMEQQPPLSVRQIENFPNIEEAIGAGSSTPQGQVAREVWTWFLDHLDKLLESVRSYRFDQFEMNLRTFWASLRGDHREVVHAPAVAGLMGKADAIVYDVILETLRSQMLTPIPPQSLTSLRQLADKMEKILLLALENYGNTFVEPKVELGARFGHLVLRFLDIYQVTQALTTVLQNPKQIADMRRSWGEIDFESVRNQAALVCNCRHEDLVQLLEVDFVAMLDSLPNNEEPARVVMLWADDCCARLMGNKSANGEERPTMSSRSVLIRWGYVTSQIMRDLTIRSDSAFGAFQILKLFLDDWIALNVLRSVALSTNSVAASVEPVIQQQFFTLSPMAGQEFTGSSGLDNRQPSHMLAHTPTTSSMLAALNDPFPASLEGGSAFTSNFSAFMDPSASSQGDSIITPLATHHPSMSFSDFASGSNNFDVAGFTQDLSMPVNNSADDRDPVVEEPIKDEVVG